MSDDMKKRFGAEGSGASGEPSRTQKPGGPGRDRSSSAPDPVDGDLSINELMRKYLPDYHEEEEDAAPKQKPSDKTKKSEGRDAVETPQPRKGGLFSRMRAAVKNEDDEPAVPDERFFDEAVREDEKRPMTAEEKEISDSLMAVLSDTAQRQKEDSERRARTRASQTQTDFSSAFEEAMRTGSMEKPKVPKRSEPQPPQSKTEERYNSGTDITIRFDPAVLNENEGKDPGKKSEDSPEPAAPEKEPQAAAEPQPAQDEPLEDPFADDTDTRETESSFFRFGRNKKKKQEPAENAEPDAELTREAPAVEPAAASVTPEPADGIGEPEPAEPAARNDQNEVFRFSDGEDGGEEPAPAGSEALDDDDKTLRVGLGMEDTLDRREGIGTAARLIRRMEEEEKIREASQRELAKQDYIEYESYEQTEEIASEYKNAYRMTLIRLAAAGFFALLLFFYENLGAFGFKFRGALDPNVYPVVYCMISLQLFLFVAFCGYEEIFRGFRNLIRLSPTPESVTSLVALAAVVCSALTAVITSEDVTPVMYNFCAASAILATLGYSFLNIRREIFSFNIVSSRKPKHVFQSLAIGDENGHQEDGSNILRIENADFVSGYFYRTESTLRSTKLFLSAVMILLAVVSAVVAIVARVTGNDGFNALRVFFVTLVAALPFALYYIFSYPFFKVNRDAYEQGSTIVGESSLEEYAGATDITFDDLNAFPADKVRVVNVKFYGNNRIDKIFYYAASVFKAAGGPLSQVFTNVVDQPLTDNVEIRDASTGFLGAVVDGRHFLFGRSSILRQLNIDIPEDAVEEDNYAEGDVSIMYIVRDLKLVAKLYIRYNMDESFENVIRQFTSNGTRICVRTLDPNIDEEMIGVKLKDNSYPIRVLKSVDAVERQTRISSGIVTRGTTKNLLQIVSSCDRILNYRRLTKVICFVSLLVTALLMFICSISGTVGMISPWMVFLYQLLWVVPAILFCGSMVK